MPRRRKAFVPIPTIQKRRRTCCFLPVFSTTPTASWKTPTVTGLRFTLITNSGNKIRESIGAQIKQDLKKLGIQVDFQPLAFNVLVESINR